MGFSTAVANVIFFSSFLIIAGILIGAGLDFQKTYRRGLDERETLDSRFEDTSLIVQDQSLDGTKLQLSLLNDGEVDIDLDHMDVFLNGDLREPSSIEIDGENAERAYEGETIDLDISDAYLNVTTSGGTKVSTSNYDISSGERITSYGYVHVIDGSSLLTLDSDCSFLWEKNTGLTDPEDLEAIDDHVLVLGDDTVIRFRKDGSGSSASIIGTGQFNNGSRITISGRVGDDPYIFILLDDGSILRSGWDGSGLTTICNNGTDVNWSGPVDIFPGNDNIHLLDNDGLVYNISYSGTDSLLWNISPLADEIPVSGCSSGMDNCSLIVNLEGDSTSRVIVFNITSGTEFVFLSDLSTGYSDMGTGLGLYIMDTQDGLVDRFELGTHVMMVTLTGYILTEVI